MLLLIDNYDSFTYNLVQYFQCLDVEVVIVRNDAATVLQCLEMEPDYVVISPGPGTPRDAGISLNLIHACAGNIPLLGVCLGMQGIAEAFGGRVIPSGAPVHGKVSPILHNEEEIFKGLPNPFVATRYHSLIVERDSLPSCLEVTAETPDGVIMALRHRDFMIEGVQFHPESVLTTSGLALLQNFLEFSHKNKRLTI